MHLNIVENLPITYCSIFCVRKSLGQPDITRHSSRKHFVPCTWLVFSRKKIFWIQKGMCCTTKTHRKQESGLLIFSCEKTFGVKYPAAPGTVNLTLSWYFAFWFQFGSSLRLENRDNQIYMTHVFSCNICLESHNHDLYNGDNRFSKQNSVQFLLIIYYKALDNG